MSVKRVDRWTWSRDMKCEPIVPGTKVYESGRRASYGWFLSFDLHGKGEFYLKAEFYLRGRIYAFGLSPRPPWITVVHYTYDGDNLALKLGPFWLDVECPRWAEGLDFAWPSVRVAINRERKETTHG